MPSDLACSRGMRRKMSSDTRLVDRPCDRKQPDAERWRSRRWALADRPLAEADEGQRAAGHVRPICRSRVQARGKFLWADGAKFYAKGVTYGTFRPDAAGQEFNDPQRVGADFAAMAATGLNCVRVYSVPPRWLLDVAQEHGLRVLVGLPWEQHITFLDSRARARTIVAQARRGVRACAGHPAVLGYAVGNEIPASIVRWHGRRPIERFLGQLYLAAKEEDPEAWVTYVNYPSTEYLELPFLEVVCFNVYLERRERLESYLARLQNLAGDRPLLLTELGLDSRRHGEAAQARSLDWQIRTVFEQAGAGCFVFAWTDEWHRGGADIEDWDFGLVRRDRTPKQAWEAVRTAIEQVPFKGGGSWPRVSVVVCSRNGARTIRQCCQGLRALAYSNFEVIVVDDGSTDRTAALAGEFGFRVIRTENRGLSSARNAGLAAAGGELVAYLDDDAWPDPDWLTFLAATFAAGDYAAVGGPNILPPGSGVVAQCVDNSPGGPVHVLLSDRVAEHIPGCNMAFRKAELEAVGGFDARFRTAGDDVDVCWRLQEHGGRIGYSPGAMVWHHCRNSVKGYWRQQRGYGQAEALLERKWPEQYNVLGHAKWRGRIYGRGLTHLLGSPDRVYQGVWGSAPFQTLERNSPRLVQVWPTLPEWFLVASGLGLLTGLGAIWPRLLWAGPILLLVVATSLGHACLSAVDAVFPYQRVRGMKLMALRLLTAFLHLLQPLARLVGRLREGLLPWRTRLPWRLSWPCARHEASWCERWQEPARRLERVSAQLRAGGGVVQAGGPYDDWDLELRGGLLSTVRLRMAVEEHGGGRQMFRFRLWPKYAGLPLAAVGWLALLAVVAAWDGGWGASAVLAAVVGLACARVLFEAMSGLAEVRQAIRRGNDPDDQGVGTDRVVGGGAAVGEGGQSPHDDGRPR